MEKERSKVIDRHSQILGGGKLFRPPGSALGFKYRKLEPLLWLLPSILLIAGVILYPAIQMVQTSFSNFSLSGLSRGFAGLVNYRDLFSEPGLVGVFKQTVVWIVVVVFVATAVSLWLAQLLNQTFPGRRVLRWAVIIPWAAPVVTTTLSWKWILNYYYGIGNALLVRMHILARPVDWVGNSSTSFYAVMFVEIFLSIPFTAYVILAGLQSIPHELYESAELDGAGRWNSYRFIVFPLLAPSLIVATVLNVIYTFNAFPTIWVMTQGGPGNSTDISATLMYKLAFQNRRVGEAGALSVLNLVVILALALIYLRIVNRRNVI
jgi:ABC-type sugar transport system permease subunit